MPVHVYCCVVGMEMKPLNGDQKAAEATHGELADSAADADATVVVLDGSQKRYQFLPSSGFLPGFLAYDNLGLYTQHMKHGPCSETVSTARVYGWCVQVLVNMFFVDHMLLCRISVA